MQIKNNLRNLVQHITYKLALLNTRELSSEEREQHEKELMDIIERNKEFLKENNLLVKDAVLDFGKLVYKCEKDKEISKIILSSQCIEKINLTRSCTFIFLEHIICYRKMGVHFICYFFLQVF